MPDETNGIRVDMLGCLINEKKRKFEEDPNGSSLHKCPYCNRYAFIIQNEIDDIEIWYCLSCGMKYPFEYYRM